MELHLPGKINPVNTVVHKPTFVLIEIHKFTIEPTYDGWDIVFSTMELRRSTINNL